jgi:hypothetical protein
MKKIAIIFFGLCSIVLMQNCGNSNKISKTKMALSYGKDVMPILQSRCTPCHFPTEGRKEPLNTYDAVKNHIAEMIVRVKLSQTDNKFMPFKNKKPPLSDSLINILEEWQRQNMPE